MVLPEDGSEYKWMTDPELKEVRKLNLFDYSKKFVMVRVPPPCASSGYSAVVYRHTLSRLAVGHCLAPAPFLSMGGCHSAINHPSVIHWSSM